MKLFINKLLDEIQIKFLDAPTKRHHEIQVSSAKRKRKGRLRKFITDLEMPHPWTSSQSANIIHSDH